MNKIISSILVIVLMFVLCACGSNVVSTETDVPAAEVSTEVPVKVGFIYLHDQNSTYDLNFLRGAQEACEELGIEYINKTNIPEGNECYEAASELVDDGCNIIFADSFGHEDYMIQAAAEHPDVQFCHATGTKAHTQGLANYHNAFASIYEGRFLAGIAAGMKLNEFLKTEQITEDEAIVGYVGAFPYAEVVSGYTSFFLGVRYVCPSATMKVIFTGTWYDESLEKEAANNLIEQGCVVLSQHADSMGAPTACELAGVPDVSYNGSTIDVAPNTFIISTRINWAPYFKYIINCVKNGEDIATDWIGDFSTNSVQMTELNNKVAAPGTFEKLVEVEGLLKEGNIKVFDVNSFTVNGEHLTSYLADVDSDQNYEADTEVIVNGYFHESEFRSAPYFDILIDHIEILGN